MDEPPDGWRWESFRGFEAAVPADWKAGSSTGQVVTQWCGGGVDLVQPVVARPGGSTRIACTPSKGEDDPGTLIENAGTFLAFDEAGDIPDGTQQEGDRTTVTIGGISFLVQASPELRAQIIDTIRPADPDFNGCPATHPISKDTAMRPEQAVDVTTLNGVTEVVACKYSIEDDRDPQPTGLLSSVALQGPDAVASVKAIASTPVGGGPNTPQTCNPEIAFGNQVIVLQIESAYGTSEIFMRYDGCDHLGFDDGVAVRTLTVDSVAPLVTGSNTVTSGYGLGVSVIHPDGH